MVKVWMRATMHKYMRKCCNRTHRNVLRQGRRQVSLPRHSVFWAKNSFVAKKMNGKFRCSVENFGDPMMGQNKVCMCDGRTSKKKKESVIDKAGKTLRKF